MPYRTPHQILQEITQLMAVADGSTTSLLSLVLYLCEDLCALWGTVREGDEEPPLRTCLALMSHLNHLVEDEPSAPETSLQAARRALEELSGACTRSPVARTTGSGVAQRLDQRSRATDFLQAAEGALRQIDRFLMVTEQRGHAAADRMAREAMDAFAAIRDGARSLQFGELAAVASSGAGLLRLVYAGTVSLEGALLDHLFNATELLHALVSAERRLAELRQEAQRIPYLARRAGGNSSS